MFKITVVTSLSSDSLHTCISASVMVPAEPDLPVQVSSCTISPGTDRATATKTITDMLVRICEYADQNYNLGHHACGLLTSQMLAFIARTMPLLTAGYEGAAS